MRPGFAADGVHFRDHQRARRRTVKLRHVCIERSAEGTCAGGATMLDAGRVVEVAWIAASSCSLEMS